jgi:hypothetical protein
MSCAAPNPLHWEDLRNRPESLILSRLGAKGGQEKGQYVVSFLTGSYLVDSIGERIIELSPRPNSALSEEFQILLLRYLCSPGGASPTGREISEKDLPGGVTFFQGPHALYTAPIAERYGAAPAAFETDSIKFGAVHSPHGDKAMRFLPFPEIPVTYVLWREDDEFPASVSVLFDESIVSWFELDMVFALVLVLTRHIAQ